MKQYSLFMCVARTLISWTASYTLVAWSITMVGHIKKSYGGLVHGVAMQTDKDSNLQAAGNPCLTVWL